jgi:hypothetical protein
MNKIFIGIDPGLRGAIAVLGAGGEVIEVLDTPTLKSEGKTIYDAAEMSNSLRHFALQGDPLVVLEQAQGMPGQGVSSTFFTGCQEAFKIEPPSASKSEPL